MFASLLVLAIGCSRAQVSPTNHTVTLSWSQATGCTATTCSYIISRATLASGVTACPATDGTNYTPLNSAAPVSGTSYVDSGASGTNTCYVAQTKQGSAISVASNSAGPLNVPANPQAPVINSTVADAVTPSIVDSAPNNELALLETYSSNLVLPPNKLVAGLR
jgi:hypothetical protein